MLRELWPKALLMTVLTACGQAEFQTTTDTAPAAAPAPSQDDSTRDREGDDDASWRDSDDPDAEQDDGGEGRECRDDLKLPRNCELTSDLRIICKDVVLTTINRRTSTP